MTACAIVVLAAAGLVTLSNEGVAQQLAPKRTLAAAAPSGCAALTRPVTSNSNSPLGDDSETRRLISAAPGGVAARRPRDGARCICAGGQAQSE